MQLHQEINSGCQQLIIDHHAWLSKMCCSSQLPCIFGDILDLCNDDVDMKSGTFSEKRRRIESATLKDRQWCNCHHNFCRVPTDAHLDLSGLPCPDNSKANRKRKFEEGPSGVIYIVWAKRHKILRTPLIIIENVPESELHGCFFSIVRFVPTFFFALWPGSSKPKHLSSHVLLPVNASPWLLAL